MAAHNDARPSPRLISKSNFDDICENHRIRVDKRKLLRDIVDGATSAIAKSMKEESSRPKRREDRLRIKKAIRSVENVQRQLNGLDSAGQNAFLGCEFFLAPLVSGGWLHDNFPDKPQAGLGPDFQDRSVDQRRGVIRNRELLVVKTILADIVRCLDINLRNLNLGAKGGRPRDHHRHVLLLMLAEAWHRMDRKMATGPRSKFVRFAEDIVGAIGWSEKGIADAAADALRDWRNRAQKKAR